MKRSYWIALVVFLGAAPIGAQVVMNVVQLVDWKNNAGTKMGAFHTPLPKFYKVPTGLINDTTNRQLIIGNLVSDAGAEIDTAGIQTGSTLALRPVCSATSRGTLYMVQGTPGDAGTTDNLFMCLKAYQTDAYAWISVKTGG